MVNERWAQLDRSDLMALGKDLVTERLEAVGCAVQRSPNPGDGKLLVRTRSGRPHEVFVTTQRVGGYVFWTKRRLQPSAERSAAVVLLGEAPAPELYLVPTTEWLNAAPPLTDRDYVGGKSEPEYGIEIGPSHVHLLRRYAWTEAAGVTRFA